MRKNAITVEYPHLIRWLRTLEAWTAVAQVSTQKEADKVIWNSDRYIIADWIKHGHGLMTMAQCSVDMAQELMWLVDIESIDPVLVASQLKQQNWDYTSTDDYSEKDEVAYYPLCDSWDMAVGCAMVLTKKALPFSVKSREWLHEGLSLFYGLGTQDSITGANAFWVDAEHETWLQTLCKKERWAREAVAQWALEGGEECPRWVWLFDDCLGISPSGDFIDSILQEMDGKNRCAIFLNPMVGFFATDAPLFFASMTQAWQLYNGLYGTIPDSYTEHEEYCAARAKTVQSMFPDAMVGYRGNADTTVASSTSPSMGRLFGDNEPSNAV